MGWTAHAPEWVSIALVLGAVLFARRYGGGEALSTLERANTVLEKRVHELEKDNARLTGEVATLNTQTNVAIAIAPVLKALETHEVEAARRSSATLSVLELIAGRLGSEQEAA